MNKAEPEESRAGVVVSSGPLNSPRAPKKNLSPSRALDRDGEGVIVKVVAGIGFEL